MGYAKLRRPSDHRNAMLRNQVTSLLKEERIQTTAPKAKSVNRLAEKMITLGKRGDLHARRQALEFLLEENVVNKVFDELASRYEDRQGGYTRIVKVGARRGDGAEMVILEMV